MRVQTTFRARLAGNGEPRADLDLSTGDPSAGTGFYVPYRPRVEFRLVVRTAGRPERLAQPLRAAIAAVDPAIRLREIIPLNEVGADEQAFLAGMASTMVALGAAALALLLMQARVVLAFRMPTTGVWVVPAVVVPLVVAGLLACWVPARRALAIQPADALKVD